MKSNIITLKIKYEVDEKNKSTILSYIKNYNNVLRFTYNRVHEGITSTKELTKLQKSMNNVFIDSYFKSSAVYEAKAIKNDKIIFGGKKLFFSLMDNKITKEEYQIKKLVPLCSIGEADKKSNRKFIIVDENTIIFKPDRHNHIILKLVNAGNNYKSTLSKLIKLQNTKQIPITYKLGLDFICLSFDYSFIKQNEYKTIKDRIIAVDLNPNYLGYSIIDRKGESNYKIIDSGVVDVSKINAIDNSSHKASNDARKLYINNKRKYENVKIAYELAKLANHYRCECFSIEKLNIKTKNVGKGRKLNKLINNQWVRSTFINVLRKLINCSSTTFIEVEPVYSSILGNLIYREEQLPDMVLSSIELGRRAYEFNNQYLLKYKSREKTVVFPKLELVKDRITQSLEELSSSIKFGAYGELFAEIKKSKLRYRLSLEDISSSKVFSLFSYKSYLKLYKF